VKLLPRLAPVVAALPPSRPFVGPEELARRAGLGDLLRLGANDALLGLGVFVREPGAAPLDGHVRVTVGTAPERARFARAFETALGR
jgi:histidinol-phosphate/aromatic aminotransferase/cobyric acid decarboxylase-like protein